MTCKFSNCSRKTLNQNAKEVTKFYSGANVNAHVCNKCAYVGFLPPPESELTHYYSNCYGINASGWYNLEEDYNQRKVESRADNVENLIEEYLNPTDKIVTLEVGCALEVLLAN